MRLSLASLFYRSPFENLQTHADKVKECAQLFKRAAICHLHEEWDEFERLTDTVARLESEADAIKRNIRNHLPKGILMQVDKFELFDYVREQDKVLDEVEEALFWLSFRPAGVLEEVAKDLEDLVEEVIPPIEKLSDLVAMATVFFKTGEEEERTRMKSLIRDIRQHEKEADIMERELKRDIFETMQDKPIHVFHLVRLVEIVGNIADHAQNASDRMRAMIAR
jgi:predicted phosphate transport protein (TIGR00153 family)